MVLRAARSSRSPCAAASAARARSHSSATLSARSCSRPASTLSKARGARPITVSTPMVAPSASRTGAPAQNRA